MFKSLKLSNFLFKDTFWVHKRGLWKWLEQMFNQIDDDRIKEVGSNMACAEWLMKNGAHVRWKGCKEFVEHYDCLPNMKCAGLEQHQFKIEEVYAGKEASISHLGFRHFRGCKNINEIAFIECQTINNEAISKLQILKENLTNLKIIGCLNVSDKGILTLTNIPALKLLELKNLQFENQQETISHLKSKLPECKIVYAMPQN